MNYVPYVWIFRVFCVVTELPQFWQWDGGSLRLNRGWEGRGITHHAMPWAERDHPPPLNHSHGVSSPPCCQSIDSRHKVSNEKEIETNFLAILLDIWAHTVMTIYNTLPESEQNWMKEKSGTQSFAHLSFSLELLLNQTHSPIRDGKIIRGLPWLGLLVPNLRQTNATYWTSNRTSGTGFDESLCLKVIIGGSRSPAV